MEDYVKIIKSKQGMLRVVGVYEIIGGLLGMYSMSSFMLNIFAYSTLTILILSFIIFFCAFSIFAGWKLIVEKEKSILYSQIVQYFQFFAVSFGGMTYLLTLGSNLFVGIDIDAYSIGFSSDIIGGDIQLFIENSTQGNYVKMNVLAIIILTVIEKAKKTILLNKEKRYNYLKAMEN